MNEALVRYLTGPNVAYYSMCLEVPKTNPMYLAAKRFFTLREACGVRGYADEEEAREAILAHSLQTQEGQGK